MRAKRFFRAPIAFDAEQNALLFPAALLDQPLPHADPRLRLLLLDGTWSVAHPSQWDLAGEAPLSAT